MGAGRIVADPLITHRVTLDAIHTAFEAFAGNKDKVLEVAIHL